MPKKRLGAEQIVTKLRQIEVLQGPGQEPGSGVETGETTVIEPKTTLKPRCVSSTGMRARSGVQSGTEW